MRSPKARLSALLKRLYRRGIRHSLLSGCGTKVLGYVLATGQDSSSDTAANNESSLTKITHDHLQTVTRRSAARTVYPMSPGRL